MRKPTVYLETSVVSYATARPSRDLIVAARQQVTREWFSTRASSHDLFVSQLVIREASDGDPAAAAERREFIRNATVLATTVVAKELAATLLRAGVVPRTSAEDALHIAVAAAHGVDYLLTWNFSHIANATMRHAIDNVCKSAGFEPPVICTPEELIDDDAEG